MPRNLEDVERPGLPLESRPSLGRDVSGTERLLTPKETACRLRVSHSWLAKARMRGDGPPFLKIGRAIRYGETALAKWLRSQQRQSTSEH